MTTTPQAAAAQAAQQAAAQVAAVPIRYRVDADHAYDLDAIPGRQETARDRHGQAQRTTSRAQFWLVDPAELIDDDDNQIVPADGHTITTWPDTDDAQTYHVQGLANLPAWQWSGQAHNWRRIRTEPAEPTA